MKSNENKFITTQECSELLRVSRVALLTWRKKEMINIHRIGRKVLYDKDDYLNDGILTNDYELIELCDRSF
jgi:hypothetical protein